MTRPMSPTPGAKALLDRLLAYRSEIERRQSSVGASGRVVPASESIPTEHGMVIRDLVAESQARTVLEIGLGNALSTMYLCEPLVRRGDWRQGDVVTIDPYQDDVDSVGLTNLARAGLQQLVAVHQEPSQLMLPRLVGDGHRFDLALIDGDHLFDGVFVDLFFVDQIVNAPGVIILDTPILPPSTGPSTSSFATAAGRCVTRRSPTAHSAFRQRPAAWRWRRFPWNESRDGGTTSSHSACLISTLVGTLTAADCQGIASRTRPSIPPRCRGRPEPNSWEGGSRLSRCRTTPRTSKSTTALAPTATWSL
jgi:predicted O-methyltransferase YrrM